MFRNTRTRKSTLKVIIIAQTLFLIILFSTTTYSSFLHAKGGKLYNDANQEVRLTGVNWFGFETSNLAPHGLWARDYHGMLLQIRQLGFNCIRIPFCDDMFAVGAQCKSINNYGEDPYYPRDKTEFNKEIIGKSPVEVMDEIVRYAGQLGLTIILDNHSRTHDGYMEEKLWYTATTSEDTWIQHWVNLIQRYKNNPAVIGCDLNNEPHGKIAEGGATWGVGNKTTDWNTAAEKCGNAILKVNPDVLIIVEGVQGYDSTNYWWGGNLRGVASNPISLSKPDKLVYSPHEYGPEVFMQDWFVDASFPNNLEGIWDNAYGFIVKQSKAPLLVGEFGINDTASYQGKTNKWFRSFLKYMAENVMSWTFWAFNPNSGDTGGILKYDWTTPEQWKVDALKPYMAPLINTPTGIIQLKKNPPNLKNYLTFSNERLSYRGNLTGDIRVKLYSINGKLIQNTSVHEISLQNIPAGTYNAVLCDNTTTIEQLLFNVIE